MPKGPVAIAVRKQVAPVNNWMTKCVVKSRRKNILMIGPTGVGKTEIARRLARLTGSPFIKVEATKYTEVGYYGRDVESMIRELVENAIGLIRKSELENVKDEAKQRAECRLVDLLLPAPPVYDASPDSPDSADRYERNKEKIRAMLLAARWKIGLSS